MPRPETVGKALAEISKSTANYRYFFEKLNSPDWLGPLAQHGLFTTPPEKEQVEGGVMFPAWPASGYLVRMATYPAAQEQVVRIVLAMNDTDNISVHADLLAIALALPARDAAKLVGKARVWVQSPYHGVVAYKIGELIAHLASGGQAQAALQLAKDVFTPLPAGPQDEGARASDVRAWLDDWHYEEALKKSFPPLVTAQPIGTIEWLSTLLARALELSQRSTEGQHEDYSYIWHEAIEEDQHPPRLRNSIISALRNAAEQAIQADASALASTLAVLRRYDWPVFKRLELHLLRTHADNAMEEIVALAPGLVELEGTTRHEAGLLLRSVFGNLPPETQDEVLRRIDAGPEEAGVVRWLEFIEVEPTPEKIAEFGLRWRAQRFALVADNVPDAWQARVHGVLTSAGEVRPADHVERGGSWVGPSSPKTAEDLTQLGPEGVVGFLRSWNPKPGPLESTPEGLGRVLEEVIAKDPQGYAERAGEFENLDPTFVRFFFSGLEGALKKSGAFTWPEVFGLAQWVVEQPPQISGRKKEFMEADPDWQWTRGRIADLLELGFQKKPAPIAYEQRAVVWNILAPLTRDPDPTPEHEAKYGGKNMDPSTMALNTVRGKAFGTLVSYALWVRRNEDRREPRPAMTFDVMPEVRGVLDEHLDVAQHPALTIRSVYGRYFPWLQHLDHAWVQAATERIFPPDDTRYFRAAWDAYVTFCPAYDAVLPLLRAQYARAVALVGEQDEEANLPYSPKERLAEHLLTYYWRGKIVLDDTLLVDFFRLASDEVRGQAIEFVGRSLEEIPEQIEPAILGRLQKLWEWRLQSAQANMAEHRHELAQFGWWFSSRKFDDTWSLEQLLAILDTTQLVEPDFKVSETLEVLAVRFPLECVRCVTRIAQGDHHDWTIHANREHFEAIIKVALGSNNVEAKAAAARLIEYLVGRGHFEYRRLLT